MFVVMTVEQLTKVELGTSALGVPRAAIALEPRNDNNMLCVRYDTF